MKKILFLVIFLFVTLNGCASQNIDFTNEELDWMKDHPVIYVGPDPVFGPIEFIDDQGRYKGIAADYIEWIEQNTPLHFEVIRFDNWGDILEALRSNDIDMLGAATYTNERSEYMLFSEVFVDMPNIIVTREEYIGRAKLEDLSGEYVVVMDDYATEDYIEEFYPDINLVPVHSIEEGLSMVSLGNKDYMLATVGQVSFYLENSTITNLKMSGSVELTFNLSFAARKDYGILIDILNKSLNKMPEKKKEQIYSKWISIEVESLISKEMFYALVIVLGVVCVIVFIILLFNRTLKRQVSDKTQALHNELLEKGKVEKELAKLNRSLESIVEARTEELQKTLNHLKSVQNELIETEKMASLSRVLVNISHKLNTPIGIGITTISYMDNLVRNLTVDLEDGKLSKSNFVKCLNDLRTSIELLETQLLVSKQFMNQVKAVTTLELEEVKNLINISIYLHNLLDLYKDKFVENQINCNIKCADNIFVNATETMLDNIFRVLIDNSIGHGLIHVENGQIDISITKSEDFIWIVYEDNGIGIDSNIIKRIYEPLFTTSMGTTSGLGLNILYNTVKSYLGGEVEIISDNQEGVTFNIKIAAH